MIENGKFDLEHLMAEILSLGTHTHTLSPINKAGTEAHAQHLATDDVDDVVGAAAVVDDEHADSDPQLPPPLVHVYDDACCHGIGRSH